MADPRYYTPPAQVLEVPGLRKAKGRLLRADYYAGSAEAMVASGLVPRSLLPGEPGNPISSASYRPLGAVREGGCWFRVPGYLQIFRAPSGLFRAALVVSREEQERRQREANEAEAATDTELLQTVEERSAAAAAYMAQTTRQAAEELRAQRRPGGRPSHLRLVWSAPGARR